MMLHIIFAQGWRLGADTHGSAFTPASGQVLIAFQLLANANTLFTTNPPWVVKSFCPSPSKSPHRPQTFPCQQGGSATLMMPTSTAVPSLQTVESFQSFLVLTLYCGCRRIRTDVLRSHITARPIEESITRYRPTVLIL